MNLLKNLKQQNFKTLYILIGIFGSGKTTWSKNNFKDGTYIVNTDDLRYMIHNGVYEFNEQIDYIVHDIALNMTIQLLYHGNVILDSMNHKKNKRKHIIKSIKEKHNNCVINGINFEPDGKNLERRILDPKGLSIHRWEKIYNDILQSYESPSLDEGFNNIVQIKI